MPEFQPVPQRNPDIPRGGLLDIAEEVVRGILQEHGWKWTREYQVQDHFGKYAYGGRAEKAEQTPLKFILIARRYVYGPYVGAGDDVLGRGMLEGRWLLIYIDNRVYVFTPKEAFDNGKISYRHGLRVFYDFKIILGVNLIRFLSEEQQKVGLDGWIT